MVYAVIGLVVCAIIALVGWALWLESPVRLKKVVCKCQAPTPSSKPNQSKPPLTPSKLRLQKQGLAWRLVQEYGICDTQAWNVAVDIIDGKLEK